MKVLAALAFGILMFTGAPLQAQVFQLPPEKDPEELALSGLSCAEIDREIEKTRKYVEMLNSEVSLLGTDAAPENPPGAFQVDDSPARGRSIDQANDRLNTLESLRLTKDCPGTLD